MSKGVLSWLDNSQGKYGAKVLYNDTKNTVTFHDFNRKTKSIGTFLSNKICTNSPVAVLSGRNVNTPAAYLGVVRAGCFYVPMDPTMPVKRLNQILGVIKSKVMIVDSDNLKIAEKLDFKGKVFVLEDIIDTKINDDILLRRTADITESSPLYVVFTSGSTGVPKGVVTSHSSLICYINGICKVLNSNDKDVLGSQSPLDYIAAVRDIYIPLKTGASTVIIPKNEFAIPVKLFETLNKYKVNTLCWSVAGIEIPAKLKGFSQGKPEYVEKVVFSGSVINGKYLGIWQENMPNARFINQYGPTETTASCTYFEVVDKADENTVLPIGKPYDNYSVFLLDKKDNPVDKGKVGEICVAGPGVTLGYYGDFERTSQVFVQNPLNKNYREIIYKTGDLGHFGADGNLYFNGRKDRQIKHMGHRVELEEIERLAYEISGINSCYAIYDKTNALIYLFYTGKAVPKEITLYFRENFPAFMVPRKIINLNALPALPNGKVDKSRLEKYFK